MTTADDLIADLTRRLAEAEKEIEADNYLLDSYQQVMDTIPPCPLHGAWCTPHARQWILSKIALEPSTDLVVFS